MKASARCNRRTKEPKNHREKTFFCLSVHAKKKTSFAHYITCYHQQVTELISNAGETHMVSMKILSHLMDFLLLFFPREHKLLISIKIFKVEIIVTTWDQTYCTFSHGAVQKET